MNVAGLTKQYLLEESVMQIATVRDGKPWICTVYYVTDDQFNLYWLSLPTRRHSQDIAQDGHIAVAVAVKFDQPIIGLQAEGRAELVTDHEIIKSVMHTYVRKHGKGQEFYDNIVTGTNKHALYRFTPNKYVLFDEVNLPGGIGHEVVL